METMSAISNPLSASNYLESVLSRALQNAGLIANPPAAPATSAAPSSVGQPQDSS
jgi:hypothetical protein